MIFHFPVRQFSEVYSLYSTRTLTPILHYRYIPTSWYPKSPTDPMQTPTNPTQTKTNQCEFNSKQPNVNRWNMIKLGNFRIGFTLGMSISCCFSTFRLSWDSQRGFWWNMSVCPHNGDDTYCLMRLGWRPLPQQKALGPYQHTEFVQISM